MVSLRACAGDDTRYMPHYCNGLLTRPESPLDSPGF
jgi:hypothetical protein